MGKVTVIGSYIVALVIDTDRLPVEGETITGRNYHSTHGGKGSNMACSAARLQAESVFMGKAGKDSFGEEFVALLKKEGVNKQGVLFSDNLPTGVGFIVSSSKGTNIIIIDIGANGDFSPEDIESNRNIIMSSDVILSPLEIPLETALAAAKIAKGKGIKSIINPAPAVDLRGVDLSDVFAITPNEVEGRVCMGLLPTDPISDEDLAKSLLDLGVENVMLTLGAKGVMWASKNGLKAIPALKVDVVDSVGAGDAFNAGLAVGLSENMSVIDSIVLGVTTASLSTQKRETIESYPYRLEVNNRIKELLDILK
ncbi:MAG: ribokinase [Bacteroidales bacterium]|nr:ribokinase [Bacteroidales bacterium]